MPRSIKHTSFLVSTFLAHVGVVLSQECGSSPSLRDVLEVQRKFEQAAKDDSAALDALPLQPKKLVRIPVYFNVILPAETTDRDLGYLSSSDINTCMDLMHSAYTEGGIYFHLVKTKYHVNETWWHNASQWNEVELEMKGALRQGGPAALNIYSTNMTITPQIGGYGSFPWYYEENSAVDGVVLKPDYFPNSPYPSMNSGALLVHETGHWTGLFVYHTFQGGCDPDAEGGGDLVSDTPAEASASTRCPVDRDSCPDLPGLDPIHNYMTYTNATCMESFTQGQFTRLREQMAFYRGVKF